MSLMIPNPLPLPVTPRQPSLTPEAPFTPVQKIALLADLHGNPIALDAVLADIEARGGVDAWWLLGDYAGTGFDPCGVLDRIVNLPNAVFIRGNGDRYIAQGGGYFPSPDQVAQNPLLAPNLMQAAGGFGWTQGAVTQGGYLDWLTALPAHYQTTLPDGTRVLLLHGTPETDDDQGLNPSLSDEQMRDLLADVEDDLILCGHFHMPMDRYLELEHGGHLYVVNPGSVSNGFMPDLRAAYAILHAGANEYRITFHRVAYDLERAAAETWRVLHPAVEYITRFYIGEMTAGWMRRWDGVSHAPVITE